VTNIPTGINGQTSSDLIAHIYPNPATDKLNIAFTGAGSKSISMTNLLGQTVYRTETSEKQLSIDVSRYDKGMYFIVVYNNNQKSQVKVVIE
ncbi:MAG TPA: T9SS type A sorting domain-containing protein, partial [Bacteroidales bacterium]|nr:T9SS type A sorting domain-containing protein [Bacteroidales bacterium]